MIISKVARIALVLLVIWVSLNSSFPTRAQQDDFEFGTTWYLPIDKQPVCVGQKVVIRGGYTLTGADPTGLDDPLAPLVPDPLAPLISTTIINDTTLGTVSPKKISVYEDSGYFTFTFTATEPGTAVIRSDITGQPSLAELTLKVTDRCHYIYGVRADFSIDVSAGGGFVGGDYYIWAGGYLKVKDPKQPNYLQNDPQDRVTLGGKLVAFEAGGCSAHNQPLIPKHASFQGEAFVSEFEPLVHVTFMKTSPFAASGVWNLMCDGRLIPVGDEYASAMRMMDGVPPNQSWVVATCPADGGTCDVSMPSLNFMSAIVSAGGGLMPVTVEMKLEKVR